MNIVEPTVAENHDHVLWTEHRNDSVHDRVGILLVVGGPTGLSYLRNDPLRFQSLILRDLFEACDLRNKNTVRDFERFRKLLLEHRSPRCV